jgi:hypothetical protein
MNNANYQPVRRRGRIFPEIQWSEEEKARRIAERNAFHQRCRAIFDPIHAQLMQKHYGWYVAVEPESGDYFLDADKEMAHNNARQAHPSSIHCVFCLNETGACGRI